MTDTEAQRPYAHLIRLKNGDDIVAEIVELSHDNIEELMLFYPLKVVYTPSEAGYSIAFIPWVYHRICDKQEFTISKNEVLFYQEVEHTFNESYWKAIDTLEKSMMEDAKQPAPYDAEEQELYDDIMDYIESLDKRTFH